MKTETPPTRQPAETSKSRERRVREKWFDRYCPSDKPGIDIGCGGDPVIPTFDQWDMLFGDKDATFMAGLPNESYFSVYASHILEHLSDPITGLQNWFRLVQPNGLGKRNRS